MAMNGNRSYCGHLRQPSKGCSNNVIYGRTSQVEGSSFSPSLWSLIFWLRKKRRGLEITPIKSVGDVEKNWKKIPDIFWEHIIFQLTDRSSVFYGTTSLLLKPANPPLDSTKKPVESLLSSKDDIARKAKLLLNCYWRGWLRFIMLPFSSHADEISLNLWNQDVERGEIS